MLAVYRGIRMDLDSFTGEYNRAYALINLEAVRRNILMSREKLPENTGIIAVIKTDAYGHGAVRVAEAVRDITAGFAVAAIEEAVELREAGIDTHIIVLGYISPKEYRLAIEHDIILSMFSYEQACLLSQLAGSMGKCGRCHIKIDTGMNRIGLAAKHEEDIEPTVCEIEKIKSLPNLICDGIFMHFATADEEDKTKAKAQYNRFCRVLDELRKKNIEFTYRHCSNSAAIIDMPECTFEWVRQGITLYGLKPSDEMVHNIELYPAMELKSHVVHVKNIQQGDEVSYGGIYVADSPRRIATVSIGYGDGYPRQLSNKGYVLIKGQRAPIVGRVCMDQLMVDITHIEGVELEDDVTLFGKDGDAVITVDELSKLCGRFNYEFVCDINKRVKRIYI